MKKLLFLLLGLAVAVSASADVTKASIQKNVKPLNKNTVKGEYVVRKAAPGTVGIPYTGMIKGLRADVPEGYAMVTLTAGDVWEDGSGYQMLLDADATAFGTIFPETGPMNTSGDVSAEVYANFEYKIPENADGVLSTTNIIINNSVSILIPAGTYDWCITNPTPGDRMWIASDNGNVGGRYDDYVFKSGCTYIFTVSLGGANDQTDVQIINPNAPGVPEIAVTPASKSALVEWVADAKADGYNLRYRPWTDLSGNPKFWDFALEDYEADLDEGFAVYDADGDGYTWGLAFSSDAEDDACFYSGSYISGVGALDPDNYLFTPDVPLKGELRFTMWGQSNSYPENLMVYAMVGEEDMIPLYDADLISTTTHTEYTADLSQFNGEIGCIVFRNYGTHDMWTIFVDDIFVGDPNDVVEVAEWINVNGITDPNYNIEGLNPNTKYEVQVMAYNSDNESDWCDIVEFTTLPKPVYILGEVNEQGWAANVGAKMDYNAEDNLYTATVTLDGRNDGYNYFSFTTELAENNDDGGWAYIAPFRFGAVSDGDFLVTDEWLGKPLSLEANGDAYKTPAGEYKLTVDLTSMKLIIEKLTPVIKLGDVNRDGLVNISDVTVLIDHLLSGDFTDSDNFSSANSNVNGDEGINIADVTALIDLLLAN